MHRQRQGLKRLFHPSRSTHQHNICNLWCTVPNRTKVADQARFCFQTFVPWRTPCNTNLLACTCRRSVCSHVPNTAPALCRPATRPQVATPTKWSPALSASTPTRWKQFHHDVGWGHSVAFPRRRETDRGGQDDGPCSKIWDLYRYHSDSVRMTEGGTWG